MPEKKPLVPRLRFPEFRNAGPWETHPISDFLTESRIEGSSGDAARKLTVKLWGRGVVEKKEYLPGSENTTYYKRRAGQFIYSKLDFVNGAFGIVPQELDGYESTIDLPAFDICPDLVATFLLEYVKRPDFFRKVGEQADGSRKAKRIQASYFLSLHILVPQKAEQQKIADCLSSLDEVITLETKKLEALKAHKRGLMQQLFPREGETTPRLRFPEFRNAGPWEVKRLGEIVKITGGGTPSRNVADFWNGDIPWISSSDVSEESIWELRITRYITPEAISKSATKIVPKNSILLVSRVGVGKLAVSRIPVCTSQDFTNLTPIQDDTIFLAYYLSAWRDVLKSFCQGLAIHGFTKEDIENLTIPIPEATTGEQQKIADCLSSLDEVIELQTEKLEALKAHKRGLMQQLFPQEVG
jgi:type I restriction enzyme S subunit